MSTSPQTQSDKPSPNPSKPNMDARTLVLCFDGTSNQYDGDNTNVVRFYSLLKKDNEDEQLCYYQPGIGTYLQPGVVSPLFQWGAKILDEAVAWYLDAHVRGGYQFLMQNYRPGDKICIFGFSRGAYTARALAGMLHKIGLLPKDNPEQIPFAYKLYKKTDTDSVTIAKGFKETFCRTVSIDFVGVWDTVASVGLIMGRSLPFTTSNTIIKTFRHALSLDEHRAKFRPNLYHRPAPDSKSAAKDPEHASPVLSASPTASKPTAADEKDQEGNAKFSSNFKRRLAKMLPGRRKRRVAEQVAANHNPQSQVSRNSTMLSEPGLLTLPEVRASVDDTIQGGTDVLEVWFAGCHSDIGGGAVPDDTAHSLANITLRWMVRQVVLSQCGINFDNDALKRANIPNAVFTGVGFPVTPPGTSRPSTNGTRPNSVGRQTQLHPENPLKLIVPDDPNSVSLPTNEPTGEPTSAATADPNPFASPKVTSAELSAENSTGSNAEESNVNGSAFNTTAPRLSRNGMTSLSTVISDPQDVVSAIHDQLKLDPLWWLLEIVPTGYSYQDGKGVWKRKIGFHLGKGRVIPDINPKFHTSVQMRMEDPNLKYTPKAQWKKNTECYVD